jgi:hypothetical protein
MALGLLPDLPVAQRTFLEKQLGRSLTLHPIQAETTFREFAGTTHIPDLARALSRGLAQLANLRAEFVSRVLPAMDGDASFLTLYHLVLADVCSPEIISALLEWLQQQHGERGYTTLLGALHNYPVVWECLLATGRLDQRALTDFRNYRAQPAERHAESDAK